jgi:hypothetical protein
MTPASAVVAWKPPSHVTNSFTWLTDWWIVNFFLTLLSLIPWRRMRRLLWWTGRLLTSYTKPVYTLRLGRDYSFYPSWYHYTSHGVFLLDSAYLAHQTSCLTSFFCMMERRRVEKKGCSGVGSVKLSWNVSSASRLATRSGDETGSGACLGGSCF